MCRYIHGTRVVLPPVAVDTRSAKMAVTMIDFNVHPKRRNDSEQHATPPGDTEYRVVDAPSVINDGVYQYPVMTCLPYAVTTKEGGSELAEYTGFMLDHEHLVGIRVSAGGIILCSATLTAHTVRRSRLCGHGCSHLLTTIDV